MSAYWLRDGEDRRAFEAEDFPLSIGGSAADVDLAGLRTREPVAFLGLSEGRLFVQPAGAGIPVFCNERPLDASHWLRDGETIRIETVRVVCEETPEGIGFHLERAEPAPLEPAVIVPPPEPPEVLEPADIRLEPPVRISRGRRGPLIGSVAAALGLALLAAFAVYLFTARAVAIAIEPPADHVAVRGGWFRWLPPFELAGRYLLRPGPYRVRAEKAGYRPLDVSIDVGDAGTQLVSLTLDLLPGWLSISTGSVEGARVEIDGELAGQTPLRVEVEPGRHDLDVEAEHHRPFSGEVEIEGKGIEQRVEVALAPLWAELRVASEPAGAVLVLDGVELGPTPQTRRAFEGRRQLELRLPGYRTWRREIDVEADRNRDLGTIALEPADGVIELTSAPPAAHVLVNGAYRGRTPTMLSLEPGREHAIRLARRGYESTARSVSVESDERRSLRVALVPRRGEIELASRPPDAELWVDGQPRGSASQRIALSAVPHVIEVRREGYEPFRRRLLPRPGFAQTLSVSLLTHEEARRRSLVDLLTTGQGQSLQLVKGGAFTMGASRREQGRRSNEVLRSVELVRPFYFSTKEITNREFREFAPEHSSGRVQSVGLDGDDQPVVQVTWEQAARFCNWLSERDGLPPAYLEVGESLVPASPPPTGYRLPTEAEWAWVARYQGGRAKLRFAWGESFPPPGNSGNYADASARGLLSQVIASYDDGHPGTAPVGSFPPSLLGIHDLGGNVSEWIHDRYASRPAAQSQRDPMGPSAGDHHVVRGAGWRDASMSALRLSHRDFENGPRVDLGFRIARYAY